MEQDILGRFNQLKSNVQEMLHKFSDQDFESALLKVKERIHKLTEPDHEIHPIHIDNYHYESHYPDDDLPLTLAKEPEPGIRYYDTENSPMAAGAEKSVAHGIDKFDDEEDEAEEAFEEDIKRKAIRTKKKVAKRTPAKKRKLH